MTDSTLLITLIVFVALAALSQLGQMIALMGLYRKVKTMQEDARPLLSKAEETLDAAKKTIEEGRKEMLEISAKTNRILDSAESQVMKIDALVSDASERARVQLEHVELVVSETVSKVQGMVHSTQEGLLKPVREAKALLSGVKSAFGFLFKSPRPSVVNATQDEEMFI
jgi:hypothetical protein